ncbi:MAG: ligase-associated DNA damage response endonuclease PdeM [Fimbriimonadaceae bacterium]
MASKSLTIEVDGLCLILRSDRTLFLPTSKTLVCADLHLGKAAHFRAHGVGVPSGPTESTLCRLTHAILETGAERMVVAGDVAHSARGWSLEASQELAAWKMAHPSLEVVLVRGNHDRIRPEHSALTFEEDFQVESVTVRHHPVSKPKKSCPFAISGHLHPGLRLALSGKTGIRVPCFWIQQHQLVMPAFGAFTGLSIVQPDLGDRIIVVAGDELLEVRSQNWYKR